MKLILVISIILMSGVVFAQNQGISVASVSNNIGDTLIAGNLHEIELRVRNIGAISTYNMSNSFQVSSPDGATWSNVIGMWKNGFDNFFDFASINYFSVDGVGADSIQFSGVSFSSTGGIPIDYDNIGFSLTFGPTNASDNGKTICIDSTWVPPAGVWQWAPPVGGVAIMPSWSGLRCYTVVDFGCLCCVGMRGNVDNDPGDNIDIADITRLIDFLFISRQPLSCFDEANVDGVGEVDIGDLTRLIDYLFISGLLPEPCLC